MQRYYNHPFGWTGMYDIAILQVHAHMAKLFPVEIKKNQVAFF